MVACVNNIVKYKFNRNKLSECRTTTMCDLKHLQCDKVSEDLQDCLHFKKEIKWI